MKINNAFNIEDKVYVEVDAEQNQYQIVAIIVMPGNAIMYRLSGTDLEDEYYEFQISKTKNILIGAEKEE